MESTFAAKCHCLLSINLRALLAVNRNAGNRNTLPRWSKKYLQFGKAINSLNSIVEYTEYPHFMHPSPMLKKNIMFGRFFFLPPNMRTLTTVESEDADDEDQKDFQTNRKSIWYTLNIRHPFFCAGNSSAGGMYTSDSIHYEAYQIEYVRITSITRCK